jgi:hypothetical protein
VERRLPRFVERGVGDDEEDAVAARGGLAGAGDGHEGGDAAAAEDAFVVDRPGAGAGEGGEERGLPRVIERGSGEGVEGAVAAGRGLAGEGDDRRLRHRLRRRGRQVRGESDAREYGQGFHCNSPCERLRQRAAKDSARADVPNSTG